ncbi:hypothetical protein AMELA_G00090180 [Ameiurus melas]|uniref:Stress-associated endoplasmic reticulum protein n=1 Tax=Ameiurus melas TaxID=219545 RepID=A0A7J6AYB4_AMEME|nr:hypothetical protein AMELA_G00090180 [Ameiurus melas]
MVAKQRIRMANEKHSKNITQRGNVAKTLVERSKDNKTVLCLTATTRGEISSGTMAFGTLRICCLWISHLSNHSEHPNGNMSPAPPLHVHEICAY